MWLGLDTPEEQRQWIDAEMQGTQKILTRFWKCSNSLLDYFDTVKKLIDKKMQESITTKSLMNAVKNFQTRQDVGRTKWRSNLPMFHVGQLRQMDINSGKRWRTEEKVSVLRESEWSSSNPVFSSNSRTVGKYNQSCIARQITATDGFTEFF